MEIVTEMLRKCVEENANSVLNQVEYEEKYNALAQRYESIKKGLEGINEKRLEISARYENIMIFMKALEVKEDSIVEFDEEIWNGTVENVIVNTDEKITFVFKDGIELEWNI